MRNDKKASLLQRCLFYAEFYLWKRINHEAEE